MMALLDKLFVFLFLGKQKRRAEVRELIVSAIISPCCNYEEEKLASPSSLIH